MSPCSPPRNPWKRPVFEKNDGWKEWRINPFWSECCQLGPPVVPFYPSFGEGSPTNIDYRKKGYPFSTGGPRDLKPRVFGKSGGFLGGTNRVLWPLHAFCFCHFAYCGLVGIPHLTAFYYYSPSNVNQVFGGFLQADEPPRPSASAALSEVSAKAGKRTQAQWEVMKMGTPYSRYPFF